MSELDLYKTNRSNDANNALPADNLNLIFFLDPVHMILIGDISIIPKGQDMLLLIVMQNVSENEMAGVANPLKLCITKKSLCYTQSVSEWCFFFTGALI